MKQFKCSLYIECDDDMDYSLVKTIIENFVNNNTYRDEETEPTFFDCNFKIKEM